MFTPLKDVVIPVIVAPPPTTLKPDLAVISPTESTLVTSSYVSVPLTLIFVALKYLL